MESVRTCPISRRICSDIILYPQLVRARASLSCGSRRDSRVAVRYRRQLVNHRCHRYRLLAPAPSSFASVAPRPSRRSCPPPSLSHVMDHTSVGRIFSVYMCIRVTVSYVSDILFDSDIRILLFYLPFEHRRTVPRPRCPCAQRRAPYDDSVNFKFFRDRFYRYDAARPVTSSFTLVFALQLSPLHFTFLCVEVPVLYHPSICINTPASGFVRCQATAVPLSLSRLASDSACFYDSYPTLPIPDPYVHPLSATSDRLRCRVALSPRLVPDDGRATSPRAPFLKPTFV